MDILSNPFYYLGATPRDSRRRIQELADEKSLSHDPNKCGEAQSILTNPRKRLAAEVAWLPGCKPSRINELITTLKSTPGNTTFVNGLPTITQTNLLSAALIRGSNTASELVDKILDIAMAFESIDVVTVQTVINEERIVAGFPEIQDTSLIHFELNERRQYYIKAIKQSLNRISVDQRVYVITQCVQKATKNGNKLGPVLVSDLIDMYELVIQPILNQKEEQITLTVQEIYNSVYSAKDDSSIIHTLVNKLIECAREWDRYAQPIQISTKSQGLDHQCSNRIAAMIRKLTVDVYNNRSDIVIARKLNNLIIEVFAEVVVIAEAAARYEEELKKIANQAAQKAKIESIRKNCESAIVNATNSPKDCDTIIQDLIDIVIPMVISLENEKNQIYPINDVKNMFAVTLYICTTLYIKQYKIAPNASKYLSIALSNVSDSKVKEQIERVRGIASNNDNESRFTSVTIKKTLFAFCLIGCFIALLQECGEGSREVQTVQVGSTASSTPTPPLMIVSTPLPVQSQAADSIAEVEEIDPSRILNGPFEVVPEWKAFAPNGEPWPLVAGYVKGYARLRTGGKSQVTIDNSQNDANVYVKLYALDSDQPVAVRQIYIPAQSKYTIVSISPGTYDVRYRDLSTGSLSRSESFDLEEIYTDDGIRYSIMTMTLYKVINGNMQNYPLSESEF